MVPVHLFRNGRNQALRIPREWELDADGALLRREDGVLTVVPVPREGLLPWLGTLEPMDVPFPGVGDDVSCRSTSPSCDVTRCLLDTDTLSRLVRDPAGTVARHLAVVGEDAVATAPIVPGELRFGAQRSGFEAEERVVVTGKGREFRRAEGLSVEDWREA